MTRVPRRFCSIPLAAAAISLFMLPASAQTGKFADKPAIQELYTRLANAMKAKDIKTIASLGTPDFTSKDPGGKVYNAKQSITMMEADLRSMKRINEVKPRILSLALDGKKATATTEIKVSAVMVQGSKPHEMKSTSVSKDALVNTPQGWKFKSVVAVSSDVTMDGQKITTTPPPAQKHPSRPSPVKP